jgi:hypothetical protein
LDVNVTAGKVTLPFFVLAVSRQPSGNPDPGELEIYLTADG